MTLRELSRIKEAAALMKTFLQDAPVGTVCPNVKDRVVKEALRPGEERSALRAVVRFQISP